MLALLFTVQPFQACSCLNIRLLVLLFSFFQGCSSLDFHCLNYCSVSFSAVPPWNSTVCPNVHLLFRLFLPGLCLLVLLFAVQPLSGLSLHKYFVLLVLLFSLFQHCSCLECVCCTTVQILSELSMPGIRRLVLMFSLFQGCFYLDFTISFGIAVSDIHCFRNTGHFYPCICVFGYLLCQRLRYVFPGYRFCASAELW